MARMTFRPMGVLLLIGILAGCGSASPATPSASLVTPSAVASSTGTPSQAAMTSAIASTATPSGSAAAPAMQVALPSGWQSIDLNEAALTNLVSVLAKTNPQFATGVEQMIASGAFKQMQFYALRYSGLAPTGNVNGIATPAGGLNLDGAIPIIEGQYKSIGATNVSTKRATLPAGNAAVIDLTLPINGPGGAKQELQDRVYLVVKDDVLYAITISCQATDSSACLKDGDSVAQSLTVGS